MHRKLLKTGLFTAILFAAGLAQSQEGHPLKGSWIGEWEGNAALGESVLVVLDWDGDKVSGVINPGTDNIAINTVELDTASWTVTIAAGEADAYQLVATIGDLELPGRSLTGTWKSATGNGKLALNRQ